MTLWRLSQINFAGHGHFDGFVVRAETEIKARQIASLKDLLEPGTFLEEGEVSAFMDPSEVSCQPFTRKGGDKLF